MKAAIVGAIGTAAYAGIGAASVLSAIRPFAQLAIVLPASLPLISTLLESVEQRRLHGIERECIYSHLSVIPNPMDRSKNPGDVMQ